MCQRCGNSAVLSCKPCTKPIIQRRRRRRLLSEGSDNTVYVEGTAHLCFPNDLSWFKGTISTNDESNYSLFGEFVADTSLENKMEDATKFAEKVDKLRLDESNELETKSVLGYYRVTLFDHFSGVKHTLPKMYTRSKDGAKHFHLLESETGEVRFAVEKVFKGMKAEMEIHKMMGSGAKMGCSAVLYTGSIQISHSDKIVENRSRAWSC